MKQTRPTYRYVVNLPAQLSRQVSGHVEDPDTPYESLDDFITAAIRNQLALDSEVMDTEFAGSGKMTNQQFSRSVLPPASPLLSPLTQLEYPVLLASGIGRPLNFLTNRLNPFSIVVRIAANRKWESRQAFIDESTKLCREIGLYLLALDKFSGSNRTEWRSVSWPVGDDAKGSMEKFKVSYLINEDGTGPLVDLGLISTPDENTVGVTQLGVDLARAPSPLMEETSEGSTTSPEAMRVFRSCVMKNQKERGLLREFLKTVDDHGGVQGKVDSELAFLHPDWSDTHVTSHRAAVIGRLRDMGVITVQGRGPDAKITILEAALDFVTELTGGDETL